MSGAAEEREKSMYRAILAIALSLIFFTVTSQTSYAQLKCDPKTQKGCLCHNIGGPRDLGANCDMTGTCQAFTDTGSAIILGPNQFLGIIIGVDPANVNAVAAHIAHGDGAIVTTFDPPLHLASVTGPHKDSNVECLATRIIPQPTEPGN